MTAPGLSSTERTRIKRIPDRARHDLASLYEVLDAGFVCHIGVTVDGSPRVIPTGYGRDGDTLYLHGSSGASSLRTAFDSEICVTVTHVDGIVYARSMFHHSVNYRSAVIFGRPRHVRDPEEKLAGLRAVTEQMAPGQWDFARQPDRKELAKTAVLAMTLDEASVKVRDAPVDDEEKDMSLGIWAGILPVVQTFGAPVSDSPGIPVPPHVSARAFPQ